MAEHRVVWRGVAWRGVAWCGVDRSGVLWCNGLGYCCGVLQVWWYGIVAVRCGAV